MFSTRYLIWFFLKMVHNGSKHVGDMMYQMLNLGTKTLCILLGIILFFVFAFRVIVSRNSSYFLKDITFCSL